MSQIPYLEKSIRLALAIVGFPFTALQALLSSYQLHKYKPIGERVRIDERYLHVNATGIPQDNNPTVILESGMGGSTLDWCLVQPELSKLTKVISYDRAGFGWSISPKELPTCQHAVDDLRQLLHNMNLKSPYILVGHSYGGMIMRLFASEYPDEVTGLILVDAVHEERYLNHHMSENRTQERQKVLRLSRLGYLLSPIGIPRLAKRHIGANRLPSPIQKMVTSLGRRNNAFQASYSEILGTELSANQLKNAQPLKHDLQVIVLSAGRQNEEWKKYQKKLLHLTEKTTQIVVEESWHSIQIYQPQAVIDAVKRILDNNRKRNTNV